MKSIANGHHGATSVSERALQSRKGGKKDRFAEEARRPRTQPTEDISRVRVAASSTLHPRKSPLGDHKPSQQSKLDPEQLASREWLKEQLTARQVAKPVAFLYNGSWVCRNGNTKIGIIPAALVTARDASAVDGIFVIRASVGVEIVQPISSSTKQAAQYRVKSKTAKSDDERKKFLADAERAEKSAWDELGAMLRTASRVYPFMMRAVTEWCLKGCLPQNPREGEPTSDNYLVAFRADKEWHELHPDAPPQLLHSGIKSVAKKRAYDDWHGWDRSPKTRMSKGPPWNTREGFSLPESCFTLRSEGGQMVCELRLHAKTDDGKNSPPVRVVVAARSGGSWAQLRALTDPTSGCSIDQARILWSEDERKWLMRISFSKPLPPVPTGDGPAIVVRRGVKRFMVVVRSDGERIPREDFQGHPLPNLEDAWGAVTTLRRLEARRGKNRRKAIGPSILELKEAIDNRRRQIKGHLPAQGRGARGHGKKRYLRALESIRRAEANFSQTWWRQWASWLARVAETIRASEVLIEDWCSVPAPWHEDEVIRTMLRRFPTAMARDAIVWALKKRGIKCRLIAAWYDLKRCPSCGADTEVDGKRVYCTKCPAAAPRDQWAAWHVFTKAGYTEIQLSHYISWASAILRAKKGKSNEQDPRNKAAE